MKNNQQKNINRIDDYYAKLAKSQGYAARSVYKLMEIQEKYNIIRSGNTLLDLGAAPGSWSQYVLDVLKGKGRVIGVDLKEIIFKSKYLNHFHAIQGSFRNEDVLTQIKVAAPFHVILSDAAPSTSGDNYIDAHNSLLLVELVINIAKVNLSKKGNLLVKIFQGGEEKQIYDDMKKLFERVKAFKPKASRNESVEIYYLGFNFQG